MEINLTRSEKTIATITLVAISVFFVMFLQVSRSTKASPQFETASAIDYTMARPDQTYSEYNLNGREIDHTFEGLPQEKTEAKLAKMKKDLVAKKLAENKKKEELKKKQTAQAKAQNQLQAKLNEQQKQIQAAERNKAKAVEAAAQTKNSNVQNNNNNANAAQAPAADQQKNPAAKKKSFAEWRNQLFSNPTTENLTSFIQAFRKNDVSVQEFQAMAQDLIDQNDAKLKGLGLMALRSAPSLASLSQLAHLQSDTLGAYQAYVDQSLMAYLQPQNLAYLNQALATKDKVLVVKTLNLIGTNLAKFISGDLSGLIDPRNRREGEVVTFSINNFKALLPALNQIGASQDQDTSGLAQQIVSMIQTNNNVAQN